MYIIPFSKSESQQQSGAKGFHLAKMKTAGFPVPDGFIITLESFQVFYEKKQMFDNIFRKALREELERIGAESYMVRSSAIGEDAADASFAGQLDSFISGNEEEEIIANIYRCWDSILKENVKSYESQQGKKLNGMAVVVQQLIQPDYAGVIFTRSHLQEESMLVEYVAGHGEKLVSGEVNPESFSVSFGAKPDKDNLPFDFTEGASIARQLELFYGHPLDIEWAINEGAFFVLQSRPITTKTKTPDIFWSNTNVNENYPEAITPLLYSVARDSYYHYFKNLSKLFQIPEEKIRALESSYTNVIGIFGCHIYYNMSSIHRIISVSPFSKSLGASFDHFVGYTAEKSIVPEKATTSKKLLFVKDLLSLNFSLLNNVKKFEQMADEYSDKAKAAISFTELRESFHGFIEIRMHSWYKASLADFFAMVCHGVLGKFCTYFYGDEATAIHNKLVQAIPNLISSRPIVLTYRIITAIRKEPQVYKHFLLCSPADFFQWIKQSEYKSITKLIEDYLENWGYRCSGELMLTADNYCDNPALYIALLQQYEKLPDVDPEKLMAEKYQERQKVISGFKRKIFSKYGILFPIALVQTPILTLLVKLASNGIASRERARLKQALLYYRFKEVINKLGTELYKRKLLTEPDDIFYLRYQEIAENLTSSDMLAGNLAERITARKQEFIEKSRLIYPDDFYSSMGDYPLPENILTKETVMGTNGKILSGLSACGGNIQGTARVLNSVLEASKLNRGDILITRQTDPGWVVVFPLISGLVVERGGMLSHGAIVSREFGIPAIVGVEKATERIKDGDIIILNADKGLITIL